jgi:hypothetical protein
MKKKEKLESILDYFATFDEGNKVSHFFRLFGELHDAEKLAKEKLIELNGSEYLITVNYSKTSIHIIITCLTDDWKQKIERPVITSTIRRLCHAQ